MNKYLFFIFFLFRSICLHKKQIPIVEEEPHYVFSGNTGSESHNGGQVTSTATRDRQFAQWHIHLNEKKKTFTGYRIQIYSVSSFGCNIDNLKEMRNKFEETFQDFRPI